MKKFLVSLIISCIVILALLLELNYNKKYIHNLEIHQRNYITCNEHQADMTTYVIEHYDDILSCGERVLTDFDKLTYNKDQYGRAEMDTDTYKALLNEYNLNYFSDSSGHMSYIIFYEDKIYFEYDNIDFENLGNEYYLHLHFVYENGKIEICPYEYTCYQYV